MKLIADASSSVSNQVNDVDEVLGALTEQVQELNKEMAQFKYK